jgi:hypothetical protein
MSAMKLFTLEEATGLLPELKRLWAAINARRAVLRRLEPEAKRAGGRAAQGGGIAAGSRYAEALVAVMENLQAVIGLGVEVKDLERGLCDFPHLRGERVVYLCWQYGEERIEWWHDVEAGFAGRQPL